MHKMHELFSTVEWDFVVTEDGVQINVKGDPQQLKAQLEAVKAFADFKKKAKAAGWGHRKSFHDRIKAHFHHHHKGCCSGTNQEETQDS